MVMGHTDIAMVPIRTVTHASINWAHESITSVINHETHLATDAPYTVTIETAK